MKIISDIRIYKSRIENIEGIIAELKQALDKCYI